VAAAAVAAVAAGVFVVAVADGVSVVTVAVWVTAEAEPGATAADDPSARAEVANRPSEPVAATAATDEMR
jgi:hypothetical protein